MGKRDRNTTLRKHQRLLLRLVHWCRRSSLHGTQKYRGCLLQDVAYEISSSRNCGIL